MYRIDIMTLFPDVVGDMLCESVLGRGQERGYIRIECHQIRDYTLNKQRQVDDYPYGGGRGAVMQADPLYQCWKHICDEAGERVHTIYMSPAGKTFCQADDLPGGLCDDRRGDPRHGGGRRGVPPGARGALRPLLL